MTLVLSVITPHYVMQASDRRLSEWHEGQVVRWLDDTNKAVFVENRTTFAYTGMARIDAVDAAEYFSHRMSLALGQGRSIEGALGAVVSNLEPYFLRIPPAHRRQAFVGVGWTGEEAQSQRTPFVICGSNYLDAEGRQAPIAREQFSVSVKVLSTGARYFLHDAGVSLSFDAASLLHAQVDHHVATSEDPGPLARILTDAIRREAAVDPAGTVGPGIMINCLPQVLGRPGQPIMLLGGAPTLNGPTFSYLPATAAADPSRAEYLGPCAATSRGSVLGFSSSGGAPGSFGFSVGAASDVRLQSGKVGQRINLPRIGRNDPCWCGSGTKYKKCHHPH
jgi:hypothetical protein